VRAANEGAVDEAPGKLRCRSSGGVCAELQSREDRQDTRERDASEPSPIARHLREPTPETASTRPGAHSVSAIVDPEESSSISRIPTPGGAVSSVQAHFTGRIEARAADALLAAGIQSDPQSARSGVVKALGTAGTERTGQHAGQPMLRSPIDTNIDAGDAGLRGELVRLDLEMQSLHESLQHATAHFGSIPSSSSVSPGDK